MPKAPLQPRPPQKGQFEVHILALQFHNVALAITHTHFYTLFYFLFFTSITDFETLSVHSPFFLLCMGTLSAGLSLELFSVPLILVC